MLLNSWRQGVRITENWKLILARSFSPGYRHLQALAHPHSRSSKTGREQIASVFFSLLTLSVSWSTSLPGTVYRHAWPFLLRGPAIPCLRVFYLKHLSWSLFLELDQLLWPAVSKQWSGYFRAISRFTWKAVSFLICLSAKNSLC